MIVKIPSGILTDEGKTSEVSELFRIWWKGHPHSGFVEDTENGFYLWGVSPSQAWRCDRYRTEYAKARDVLYSSGFLVSRENPTGDARRAAESTDIETETKCQGGPSTAQQTA